MRRSKILLYWYKRHYTLPRRETFESKPRKVFNAPQVFFCKPSRSTFSHFHENKTSRTHKLSPADILTCSRTRGISTCSRVRVA